MILTLDAALAKYGPIVNGIWRDEAKWCIKMMIPDDIALNWINVATGVPTTHIYVNRDMADPLLKALQNARDRGLLAQLKTFDGCFMVRDVRGEPGKPSCHSYALAIDVNAATNKLGMKGDMTKELVQCFTDEKFSWGGIFKRSDYMHFSYAFE